MIVSFQQSADWKPAVPVRQRATSAAVVALLHAGVIAALIAIMNQHRLVAPEHVLEVLLPPPRAQVHNPAPALPLTAIHPDVPPSPTEPNIEIVPEQTAPSALEGVGRALFGCEPDRLANLAPQERAPCLHFSGKPKEPSVMLGPFDANSPWAQAVAKRNAVPVPVTHACTYQESPIANLGMPCFDFTGGSLANALQGKQ